MDLHSGETTLALVDSDNGGIPGPRFLALSADGNWVAFRAVDPKVTGQFENPVARLVAVDLRSDSLVSVKEGPESVDCNRRRPIGELSLPWAVRCGRGPIGVILGKGLDDLTTLVSDSERVATDDWGLEVFPSHDAVYVGESGPRCAHADWGGPERQCARVVVASVPGTDFALLGESLATRDGDDVAPSISADGRFIVFMSDASNVVEGDSNTCKGPAGEMSCSDIYVFDQSTGVTELVSRTPVGAPGNNHSRWPRISADGRIIAFVSWASNLVQGDLNGQPDVFAYDLETRRLVLVSEVPKSQ